MQYMLLIYGQESAWAKQSEAQQQAEMQEYFAVTTLARERGIFVSAEEFEPTSKAVTLRLRDGKRESSDGPFAETREQLGGFYLLNCKDMDEALEMAAKIPAAKNGSIEIRPIVNHG
ncbi:MAG: YciI family protein [Anaerolineae bacterium]